MKIDGHANIPLQIKTVAHCRLCSDEKPEGTSPQEWAWIEAGFVDNGVQIWCLRHRCNIALITFDIPEVIEKALWLLDNVDDITEGAKSSDDAAWTKRYIEWRKIVVTPIPECEMCKAGNFPHTH